MCVCYFVVFSCAELTIISVFTAVETSHSKHWTITIMQKPAKVHTMSALGLGPMTIFQHG